MESKANRYLKIIKFSKFVLWDVKRYYHIRSYSFNNAVYLGDILTPVKVKISKEELIKNEWKIIAKINFSGELFLRDIDEINTYKGSLNKVPQNSIIYSKINVRHGCVYYHGEHKDPFAVSTEYPVFTFNTNKINGEYIKLVLRSSEFKNILNTKTSGISKARVKIDEFLNIQIPLPSLNEQNKIVEAYNKKTHIAEKFEKEAQELEKSIEDYLFEELGIEKKEKTIKTTGLNIIRYKKLDIWGADKLLRGGLGEILESQLFENRKLNDLVYINPKTNLGTLNNEDPISFIPMKNISDDYGEVISKDVGQKSNSGGYTKFKEGDLIWARITPCMQNGKSAILSNLENGLGYGSTEYHVLRQKKDCFSIEFLYHLLRTKAVREDAVNHFTGSAGQQRVPKAYLENLSVPVPPLEIQKQISDHISGIKSRIKDLHKQSEQTRESAIHEFENEIFEL